MQPIRKALFIFIISWFFFFYLTRDTVAHNVHRLIYKANAKPVQYIHVKNKYSWLMCNKKKLTIGISITKSKCFTPIKKVQL